MFFLDQPGAPNPPLDGVTPVFEQVGADPTVAPGLDRPPHSCVLFDGNWYWKFGQGLTDWMINPFTAGGGGGAGVADWTLGSTRFYAVGAGGSDAAAGFSDVSAAAAWAVRKATWAGLLAVLPRLGNGRDMQIMVGGAGTAYGVPLTFGGFTGFRHLHLLATTDGSDDATDRILSGFVQSAAGSGPGGVWTCGPGGSVSAFEKTDAAALPSEANGCLRRVRFTGNVTPALANATASIYAISGDEITVGADLPAAPADGDTFTIEQAGAVFTAVSIIGVAAQVFVRRGIRSASTWDEINVFAQANTHVFNEAVGIATLQNWAQLATTRVYRGINGVTNTVGTGLRASAILFRNGANLSGDCSGSYSSGFTCHRVTNPEWGAGCLALASGGDSACVLEASGESRNTFGRLGATSRPLRLNGNLQMACYKGVVRGVQLENAANPLNFVGQGNDVTLSDITGSTGNTGPAMRVDGATMTRVIVDETTMLLTSAGGEIIYAGAGDPPGLFADLGKTNVVDVNGNEVQGSAGRLVDQCFPLPNETGATVEPGSVGFINGDGEFALADATVADGAAARAEVVAVTTAEDGAAVYVATLQGGRRYVLAGAVAIGDPAYVSATPGALTANSPGAGEFSCYVGTWVDGTDAVAGHIVSGSARANLRIVSQGSLTIPSGAVGTSPELPPALPGEVFMAPCLYPPQLADDQWIAWAAGGGEEVRAYLRDTATGRCVQIANTSGVELTIPWVVVGVRV